MKNKTFEDFEKEAQQYYQILVNYKKAGQVFSDRNFHPALKIPEPSIDIYNPDYEWKRIDEYYQVPLFSPKHIHPDFVQQGSIGDCYFIAALSRIAKQPDLVKSLFDTETSARVFGEIPNSINLKCGAVVVKLHAFGREVPILIDTQISFEKYKRNPRFVHPSDIQYSPWFCLVEKAFAKLQGSYSAIISGTLSFAIYSLFGYYQSNKSMKDLLTSQKMKPFEKLLDFQSKACVIGASIHNDQLPKGLTEKDVTEKGLCLTHIYVVTKVRAYKGMEFLCLRNPWGSHEWLGDYSDTSPLWTPELKKMLGMKPSDDGAFWMCSKDFFQYYTSLSVAKPIPASWFCSRISLTLKPDKYDGLDYISYKKLDDDQKVIFQFKLKERYNENEKCFLYFLIERRFPIFDGNKKNPTSNCILFCIDHSPGLIMTNSFQTVQSITSTKFQIQNPESSMKIMFHRSEKQQFSEDVSIKVFCKYDFTLCNIKTPNELLPREHTKGILIDNSSKKHYVQPKLMKKVVDSQVVTVFADPNSTNFDPVYSINDSDFEDSDANEDNDTNEDDDDDDEDFVDDESQKQIEEMKRKIAEMNKKLCDMEEEQKKKRQKIGEEQNQVNERLQQARERKRRVAEEARLANREVENEKRRIEAEKRRILSEDARVQQLLNDVEKEGAASNPRHRLHHRPQRHHHQGSPKNYPQQQLSHMRPMPSNQSHTNQMAVTSSKVNVTPMTKMGAKPLIVKPNFKKRLS